MLSSNELHFIIFLLIIKRINKEIKRINVTLSESVLHNKQGQFLSSYTY